jgi:hypothetical protein
LQVNAVMIRFKIFRTLRVGAAYNPMDHVELMVVSSS